MSKTIDKPHASVEDEIAKIYLRTSNTKRKRRFIPRFKISWVVAIAASFLALASLVFKSNIDVKIRILSEVPGVKREGVEEGISFVKGGSPNKDMVKNIAFLGDAGAFSRATDKEVVLCNSRGYGWANYTIELKEPIDLSRLDIRYTARGERGDERLLLVIVDIDRRSYRMEKDLSSELTKDWETYTINFRPVRNALDLENISLIRFEFGSLTAGNYRAAAIFLKDIYATRHKRLRWL